MVSYRLAGTLIVAVLAWPSTVRAEHSSQFKSFEDVVHGRYAIKDPADGETPDGSKAPEESAPKVGLLGDFERIQVNGAQSYKPRQIRNALAISLRFQAAARPSADLADLVDTAAREVLAGYLHAGFLKAAVTADYDSDVDALAVHVVEGPRFRAGDIAIVGAKQVDAAKLAGSLQRAVRKPDWQATRGESPVDFPSDDDLEPVWKIGDYVAGDEQSLDVIKKRVDFHLLELGFGATAFQVRLDPTTNPPVARLVVDIKDEGRPAEADQVHIEGLTRHTQQEVLDFLKLRTGSSLNAHQLKRIHDALRDSCRFWQYTVGVQWPATQESRYAASSSGEVTLRIQVVEYDRVPLLGQPLPEIDACLIRTANWLEEMQNGKTDDEIVGELACPSLGGSIPLGERLTCRYVASPKHGLVMEARGSWSPRYKINHAAAYGRDNVAFYDWIVGKKLDCGKTKASSCSIAIAPAEHSDAGYTSRLVLGMGHNVDAAKFWSFQVEPVAVVDFAHRPGTSASLDNGILTIDTEISRLQFEQATGKLLSANAVGGGGWCQIRVGRGEFERLSREIADRGRELVESYDKDAPAESACDFALESFLAQPICDESPLAVNLGRRLQRLLKAGGSDPFCRELLAGWSDDVGKDEKDLETFGIPSPPIPPSGDDFWDSLSVGFRYVPWLADRAFPRGSWPWTLLRETTFIYADRAPGGLRKGFNAEYYRVFAEKQIGPLGLLFVANLYRYYSPGPQSKVYIAQNLSEFADADLQNDISLFVRGDGGFARLLAAAVHACDDLSDEEKQVILDELPESWSPFLKRLFARRAGKSDEPPADSIESVLTEEWKQGLETSVRERICALAGVHQWPTREAKKTLPDRSTK